MCHLTIQLSLHWISFVVCGFITWWDSFLHDEIEKLGLCGDTHLALMMQTASRGPQGEEDDGRPE